MVELGMYTVLLYTYYNPLDRRLKKYSINRDNGISNC